MMKFNDETTILALKNWYVQTKAACNSDCLGCVQYHSRDWWTALQQVNSTRLTTLQKYTYISNYIASPYKIVHSLSCYSDSSNTDVVWKCVQSKTSLITIICISYNVYRWIELPWTWLTHCTQQIYTNLTQVLHQPSYAKLMCNSKVLYSAVQNTIVVWNCSNKWGSRSVYIATTSSVRTWIELLWACEIQWSKSGNLCQSKKQQC